MVARLTPMLRSLARRLGPVGHEEDAVQEALLRVVQQIGRVDLGRESTARTFIMNAGVFAIRTFNTKIMRENRRDKLKTHRTGVVQDPDLADFPPVLSLYFRYIMEHGTILGAHKSVGDELGIHKASAFRRFHQEAKTFMEGL
jgi:hypothetical protein